MKDVLIVGSGGLAREFLSYFSGVAKLINPVGFYTTNSVEFESFGLPGKRFDNTLTPKSVGTRNAVIAIGNPAVKLKLYNELKSAGFDFPSFLHPSSVVSPDALIEDGVIVGPNCVVSPNVMLGLLSCLNFCCGIGHDAQIGRFVQVNPGCQLGGGSVVGDGTLIGSGSTVLQTVKIGTNVIVGSGSVVFSRIPDGATVMGNPAKRMRALEK